MEDDDVTELLADHRLADLEPGRTRFDRAGVIAEIGERPALQVDAWVEDHAGTVDASNDLYELPAAALQPAC
jgi:hypothetical protein